MERSAILGSLKELRKHHESELKRLDRAIEALNGDTTPKPRATRGPAKPKLTIDNFLEVLPSAGEDGMSAEDVAEKMGADLGQVKRELNFHFNYGSLERAGKKGEYTYTQKAKEEW